MDQLVSFHKKLINNTMESNNSRSHSTSQTKKNPTTIKTHLTQIRNQIQVLMLKLRLIQTLLSEKLVETTKPGTMPIFPESHISLMPRTPPQLSDNPPTDGKEMLNTLDQPNLLLQREDQTHLLLLKSKSTQMDQLVSCHKKLINSMMVFNN